MDMSLWQPSGYDCPPGDDFDIILKESVCEYCGCEQKDIEATVNVVLTSANGCSEGYAYWVCEECAMTNHEDWESDWS